MELETVIVREIAQMQKVKCHMFSPIWMLA